MPPWLEIQVIDSDDGVITRDPDFVDAAAVGGKSRRYAKAANDLILRMVHAARQIGKWRHQSYRLRPKRHRGRPS